MQAKIRKNVTNRNKIKKITIKKKEYDQSRLEQDVTIVIAAVNGWEKNT